MPSKLKVVMFTDQVESTANTARRSRGEILQTAKQQDELTKGVLEVTSGILLKDTGDGCLALFPAVLEAVQAGVLLQRRVAERNSAETNDRLRFELHIGIDVGELVVLDNGDLRGDAANRCARVCSECPAGEVYLSETAALMIKPSEVTLKPAGDFYLKGINGTTKLHSVSDLRDWPQIAPPNPFIWRGGITVGSDFFDREQEQRSVRSYVRGRQNCQIVGARRIGKTSLLKQIERESVHWDERILVAYIDLQDPRCYTLRGWLMLIRRQYGWSRPVKTLVDFAECIEEQLVHGLRPVLCLDEFEVFTTHRAEFTRDFFHTLRAFGQKGLSIITASQRPLSELTDRGDPTSPFYNTFPLIRLSLFTRDDADDFVNLHRPGTPAFTAEEKAAILQFAKDHPLGLQVACFHVTEAKQTGVSLTTAISRASENMGAHMGQD